MKSGVVLAALVVIGFTVFELYAATRNGYRMEPAFVFGEFVEARQAAERCGVLKADPARFEHNFAWARFRAGVDHVERAADGAAETWLTTEQNTRAKRVDEAVDELGCKDPAVRKFLLRYRNLARLKLPAVPADR